MAIILFCNTDNRIRRCKIIEKYLNEKSFLGFFGLLCITLHLINWLYVSVHATGSIGLALR